MIPSVMPQCAKIGRVKVKNEAFVAGESGNNEETYSNFKCVYAKRSRAHGEVMCLLLSRRNTISTLLYRVLSLFTLPMFLGAPPNFGQGDPIGVFPPWIPRSIQSCR